MAVKIVKYGEKRRVVCPTCGCILEFEKKDVEIHQTGMNEWTSEITCPNCKEKVEVHI